MRVGWVIQQIFWRRLPKPRCRRVEIWCLIFNLLYGTNSVTTIDWKTFLPYCSHKLITQYIQLRSSQPAFISANYFWRWLYKPFEENWQNELGHDSMSQWLNVSRPCLPHVISRVTWILCIDCIVTREKWWWIIEQIVYFKVQYSILLSRENFIRRRLNVILDREGTTQLYPFLVKGFRSLMFNSIFSSPTQTK